MVKITQFDELYPTYLGLGLTDLTVAESSNAAYYPDVVGGSGDLTVVQLYGAVSLSSNMGDNTVGSVLTTIQSAPWVAQFAVSSNAGTSFGSNATRVSEDPYVGALTTSAREDHIHDGIGTITASSSNTMQRGTFNLRAGDNVAFGLTDGDSDGELDTLTIHGLVPSRTSALVWVMDGGGSELSTGVSGYLSVPFACSITKWRLLGDVSGALVVDVWKDTYANYPPTDADSITGSTPPTITASDTKGESTVAGWTTSLAAGDTLGFNVDSVTSITKATLTLSVTRTG